MPTPTHPKVKQCTHIKANGIRCGSPAMKNQYFCFFHTHLIKGVPRRVDARIGPLSMLEDADAIQVSIMDVMQEIRQESIDCHRASLLVKLLHLAYRNVKNVTFEKPATKRNAVREVPNYAVQFLAEHPEYGPPLESAASAKTVVDPLVVKEASDRTTTFAEGHGFGNLSRTKPRDAEKQDSLTDALMRRNLVAAQPANDREPDGPAAIANIASPAAAPPPPSQDVSPPPATAPNTPTNSSDPPPDSPPAAKASSLWSALEACMAAKPELAAAEPRKIAASVSRESNRSDTKPLNGEGKPAIDRELVELLRHVAALPAAIPRKPGQSRSAHKKDSRRRQRELREIRRAVKALPRALKGNWRGMKAAFEFAGIFPKKNGANGRSP